MNPGHTIFKRAQRLQGGTGNVLGPGELADLYAALLKQGEHHRAEQLNEVEGYGNSPDVIYPEELELKHREDQMKAERALARAMGQQQYASGTSNVGSGIFKNAQRLQGGTGQLTQGKAPWDYFNPWGGTTKGGSGTGVPTQKAIGTGVGTVTNFFVPGLGYVTGPIARWITSMIQHGLSPKQAVQQAQQQQPEQPETPTPTALAPPTTPTTPSAGVGIDPWGNPADPGEWWSNDFGRYDLGDSGEGAGGYNLAGPGGVFGMHGLPSGHTVQIFDTAIGLGGEYGGGSNAGDTSRFASAFGYSKPYTEAQYNAPSSSHGTGQGPGYKLGPGWTPRASYQQYLQGFHPIGTVGSSTGPGGAAYQPFGPKGIGGGTPSSKPNLNQKTFAMGTSSVNPGSKLFHAQLKRKK